jgi:hypothetical protein
MVGAISEICMTSLGNWNYSAAQETELCYHTPKYKLPFTERSGKDIEDILTGVVLGGGLGGPAKTADRSCCQRKHKKKW